MKTFVMTLPFPYGPSWIEESDDMANNSGRDEHLNKLESALATAPYAPKADANQRSIAEFLDALEASHKHLGEDIAQLRARVTDQANLILELIRTTSK